MKYSKFFIVFLALTLPAFGQESGSGNREERPGIGFFAAPLAELNLYSLESAAFGYGGIFGIGYELEAGLKTTFSQSDDLYTLELALFIRYYILHKTGLSGPFIQLEAGASVFDIEGFRLPTDSGNFYAGLSGGWRFLFGNHLFLDSTIRFGYPVIAGLGVSFGVKL